MQRACEIEIKAKYSVIFFSVQKGMTTDAFIISQFNSQKLREYVRLGRVFLCYSSKDSSMILLMNLFCHFVYNKRLEML